MTTRWNQQRKESNILDTLIAEIINEGSAGGGDPKVTNVISSMNH